MIRIESDGLLPRFLMHYFQSSELREKQINKLLQSSSMKNIPMEKIRRFEIPIPPLEIQKKVIGALDQFDYVCNSFTRGIPAEIEARQKQYEYYRDKLLTFKERKVDV